MSLRCKIPGHGNARGSLPPAAGPGEERSIQGTERPLDWSIDAPAVHRVDRPRLIVSSRRQEGSAGPSAEEQDDLAFEPEVEERAQTLDPSADLSDEGDEDDLEWPAADADPPDPPALGADESEPASALLERPSELDLDDAWDQEPDGDGELRAAGRSRLIPPLVSAAMRSRLLDEHLATLATAYAFLRFSLDSGDLQGETQAAQESRQLAAVDAIGWLGPDVAEILATRIAAGHATGAGEAFALALPLLSLEGADGVEVVRTAAAGAETAAAVGYAEAVRRAPNAELRSMLPAWIDATADPANAALLVPALVDHSIFDERAAVKLVARGSSGLIVATARAAVISGLRGIAPVLERVAAGNDPDTESELLAAAAVLGSDTALAAARARLADGAARSSRLLAAVAACGDDEDAALIGAHARAGAPGALQALAWLGSRAAVAALRVLNPGGGSASSSWRGAAGAPGAAQPERWLRDRPWSAADAAAFLADSSASARDREFVFLDLVARTGLHVPYDVTWLTSRRRRAAEAWTAALAGRKMSPFGMRRRSRFVRADRHGSGGRMS